MIFTSTLSLILALAPATLLAAPTQVADSIAQLIPRHDLPKAVIDQLVKTNGLCDLSKVTLPVGKSYSSLLILSFDTNILNSTNSSPPSQHWSNTTPHRHWSRPAKLHLRFLIRIRHTRSHRRRCLSLQRNMRLCTPQRPRHGRRNHSCSQLRRPHRR
jgi:hypothetical protein